MSGEPKKHSRTINKASVRIFGKPQSLSRVRPVSDILAVDAHNRQDDQVGEDESNTPPKLMPPFDNAELEYEVGGCHLESRSSREVRAFAENRSRNRDGRVGAGRGSGPRASAMPIERGLSLRSRRLISRCETTA